MDLCVIILGGLQKYVVHVVEALENQENLFFLRNLIYLCFIKVTFQRSQWSVNLFGHITANFFCSTPCLNKVNVSVKLQ